jgi:ribosomal protein S27AE
MSKRLDPVTCPRCGSDLVGMQGVRLVCYDCAYVWSLTKLRQSKPSRDEFYNFHPPHICNLLEGVEK